jgi:5-formyltetrahydrofolate cyclo-ligase
MPHSPGQIDKAVMRRQLRERRKTIGTSLRQAAGSALVRLALRHHLLAKGRRIGIYMPANSEIDVLPLQDRALAMQSSCFFPVVPRKGRKRMWFSQMGKRPAWVLNRYGIPEYRHPQAKRVRAQRLDLLFMPLLGFDSRGFRLGMGGGYYDASLAYLKRFRRWRRPRVVGVAFSLQEVERVANDPWDIPLDAVLTEQEYRVFRINPMLLSAQPDQ